MPRTEARVGKQTVGTTKEQKLSNFTAGQLKWKKIRSQDRTSLAVTIEKEREQLLHDDQPKL